jgi:hypothetical protein
VTETRPDINLEDLESLLRRIEARAEMEGWHDDADALLFVVYDRCDESLDYHLGRLMASAGKPVRNRRYVAQPMIGKFFFDSAFHELQLQPPAALRKWAGAFVYAREEDLDEDMDKDAGAAMRLFRMMMAEPAIIGFAFRFESYTVSIRPADDDTRNYEHLSQHPKSQETRIVCMVDVQDRVHQVTRLRGEPTIIEMDGEFQGFIIGTLRMLTDQTMDRVPRTQAEFDWRYADVPPLEVYTGGPIPDTVDG